MSFLPLIHDVLLSLAVLIIALINVAYLTLLERKVLASMQARTGPNVVGILGVLQPIGDAIKLMGKELILPTRANSLLFTSAPILALFLALLPWLVLPLQGETLSGNITGVIPINYGLLFLFAISGLAVYPVLIAG